MWGRLLDLWPLAWRDTLRNAESDLAFAKIDLKYLADTGKIKDATVKSAVETINSLNQRLVDRDREIASLKSQNSYQSDRIANLESELGSLDDDDDDDDYFDDYFDDEDEFDDDDDDYYDEEDE